MYILKVNFMGLAPFNIGRVGDIRILHISEMPRCCTEWRTAMSRCYSEWAWYATWQSTVSLDLTNLQVNLHKFVTFWWILRQFGLSLLCCSSSYRSRSTKTRRCRRVGLSVWALSAVTLTAHSNKVLGINREGGHVLGWLVILCRNPQLMNHTGERFEYTWISVSIYGILWWGIGDGR